MIDQEEEVKGSVRCSVCDLSSVLSLNAHHPTREVYDSGSYASWHRNIRWVSNGDDVVCSDCDEVLKDARMFWEENEKEEVE